MGRCSALLFILAATAVISGGCNAGNSRGTAEAAHQQNSVIVQSSGDEDRSAAQSANNVLVTFDNLGAIETKFDPEFADKDVIALVKDGYERHGEILYPPPAKEAGSETGCYYVPDEYDTFDDMIDYLEKAYAPAIARELAERYRNRHPVQNGRYCTQPIDSPPGKMDYDWPQSKVKPLFESEDGSIRRYALLVPGRIEHCCEDSCELCGIRFAIKHIEMCLCLDGWRLNSVIEYE